MRATLKLLGSKAMQTRRHYGSLRYLRNRALTFASMTNCVALAILVVRSTAGQSGLHFFYALNLLSFLFLATLWWRYVKFPTQYVPPGSYGHTFVDFVMSAIGIAALFFFDRPTSWFICCSILYLIAPVKDLYLRTEPIPLPHSALSFYYEDLGCLRKSVWRDLAFAGVLVSGWAISKWTQASQGPVLGCVLAMLTLHLVAILKSSLQFARSRNPDGAFVPAGRDLDEGHHAKEKREWWYLTGILTCTQTGDQFAFHLCFFRSERPIRWYGVQVTPRLYCHVSVFDCQTKQRICREKLYLPSPLNVKMSEYTTHVELGESRIRLTDRNELKVKCDFDGGHISFASEPAKRNLRIGGGSIPLGAGGEFAKFYSLPDLRAIGKLRVGGKERDVAGSIWFDHEWGSWSWGDFEEWIWARVEIDPHRILLVHVVKTHSLPVWKRLVLLSEGGVEEREDFDYKVLRKWRSPATGVEYPVSVLVSDCGDVAGFRLEAMSDGQEFLSQLSRFKGYWEGCCNVYRGSDKVGRANLEMVRT